MLLSLLITYLWSAGSATAISFNIGSVANEESIERRSLSFAVKQWNDARTQETTIRFKVVNSGSKAHDIEERVCDILQRKPVAIIVPSTSKYAANYVRRACEQFRIPCVDIDGSNDVSDFGVNAGIPREAAGRALAAFVTKLQWANFVLFYQRSSDLAELGPLLELTSSWPHPGIVLRQLPKNNDLRAFLKHIRNSVHATRMVIHTKDISDTYRFLQHARIMRMTDAKYSYAVTNMDLSLLEEYVLNSTDFTCNITGLRLINNYSFQRKALMYAMLDAVNVIGEGLAKLLRSNFIPRPAAILCDDQISWSHGNALLNEMSQVIIHNSNTGFLRFDDSGRRTNISFEGIGRKDGKFFKLGSWTEREGWKLKSKSARTEELTVFRDMDDLTGLTLRVVVQQEEPFIMQSATAAGYEGFCIDLLEEMAAVLHFNYTIFEVDDGSYGIQDEHGRWNGLVGVLQRGEADLSVSAVTITYSRVEVIDFTVPFMHLGISILFKRPDNDPNTLFTFLHPLEFGVWIYLFLSYLLVSLMMWLLARFSPYEWYKAHPDDRSMDKHKNQFTILNSLWFSVGSLMQQGSDVSPRGASTRIVAVVWYMFTLLMISSYTAQLAAFLTMERMATPIESAADLAAQHKVTYGTLASGSTMDFFRESRIPIYERMWAVMQSASPSAFVNSSREGTARVKAGNYAYLMESSMLEYHTERDCDLMRIGGLLDSKGYGLALPKGSPLREPMSQTILMLQENTVLESLKNKWWKDRRGGGQCSDVVEHNQFVSSFNSVGGIFYLLFCGLCTAFALACFEFALEARRKGVRTQLSAIVRIWAKWQRLCHRSRTPGVRPPVFRRNSATGGSIRSALARDDRRNLLSPAQVRKISSYLTPGEERLVLRRLSHGSAQSAEHSK